MHFLHVFPGAVRTAFAHNSGLPWFLTGLSAILLPLIGRSKEDYAQIPFFLLATPDGRDLVTKSNTYFWNENVEPVKVHPNTLKPENREKVWSHLMSKLSKL